MPLHAPKVWRRDPRHCPVRLLERTFIGDEELLNRLIEQIAQSAATPNKHYNLLVGAAGIGKTHTIAVVVQRVRRQIPSLPVVWLPEQPDSLASESHLFRAIASALGVDPVLDAGAQDRQLVASAAREAITARLDGAAFLLVIENLDQVLAALGELGQRALRGFLQQQRSCTVLASARQLSVDLVDQGRPFFGFFSLHRLVEMSAAVSLELLLRLERVHGNEARAQRLQAPESRSWLCALHHLLGGRPSRYVDLLDVVRGGRDDGALDDPVALLLRALDVHGIRHAGRVQQLSWQQRLILDWLAHQPAAVPVKAVAQACLISEPTVSPQLRGLLRSGFVRATPVGRQTYYEVADPLIGIDTNYAMELFGFLRQWYADPVLAMQQPGSIAGRLRAVAMDSTDGVPDPRRLLALPQLERVLIES